ncbi:Na(+) H(+) antiporter subunit G [uncultured Rubrobacteraceae bacterium]|uniref:Na(+) H(+) antiporter subunit G n=1 Tax=uncultured Rubrobacteraceae bacterium TaxID=349277 RepID=A0A6J4QNK7_9ACTN|nr:Na(+) H(+) antiporter subunit G [uncultured Rubrobacteraceae bacterium]
MALASALSLVVPYLADALVVLGVFVMTVGLYGVIRMPDTYTRLHAASKVVFLGIVSLLVASAVTWDREIILRASLIAAFLVLTTPVSAHVIARAAYRRGERMEAPGAVDESGQRLNRGPGSGRQS